VNSTLVYGNKDAILVDAQFVMSEAYRVAAMILESKKNLTTVYITHPHPDHYFGIAVLKQAFPNTKFVALPATLAGETLQIVGGVQGDGPNNSYVWIPSLRAVIAGDIVFNGSHFTPPKMPQDWIKTLDQIADLKPVTVVPGHQGPGVRNDSSSIGV